MTAEAARADRELQMMEALVDCAHELAVAFGNAAKAEANGGKGTGLLDAFLKSFQAARLGIRLCLTLRSGRAPVVASPAREPAEAERPEPLETECAERDEAERPERMEAERDRDQEAVSLPKFLSSLRAAAAVAGEMTADLAPHIAARTLPTLSELLADGGLGATVSAAPRPAGGTDLLIRRSPAPPGTAGLVSPWGRLMGSAAAPPPGILPRPPPRRSG